MSKKHLLLGFISYSKRFFLLSVFEKISCGAQKISIKQLISLILLRRALRLVWQVVLQTVFPSLASPLNIQALPFPSEFSEYLQEPIVESCDRFRWIQRWSSAVYRHRLWHRKKPAHRLSWHGMHLLIKRQKLFASFLYLIKHINKIFHFYCLIHWL